MAYDPKDTVADYINDLTKAIQKEVGEHMDRQPYSIICSDCGSDLAIEKQEIDYDLDLKIEVAACEVCKKESFDEGVEEGEKHDD